MQRFKLAMVSLVLFGLAAALPAPAQGPSPQGERRGGMQRFMGQGVGGTITAMDAQSLTLQTAEGKTVTVKVSGETRWIKDRQPAAPRDFKVGDLVMAGGEQAGADVWNARIVAAVNPEAMQRMGGGPSPEMMQRMREGLGREFIAGEIKAIDELRLTIARVDGETQEIEVDEETSFLRGRENITFAEFKVGDHVMGQGALKDGIFVPRTLRIVNPQQMMRLGRQP